MMSEAREFFYKHLIGRHSQESHGRREHGELKDQRSQARSRERDLKWRASETATSRLADEVGPDRAPFLTQEMMPRLEQFEHEARRAVGYPRAAQEAMAAEEAYNPRLSWDWRRRKRERLRGINKSEDEELETIAKNLGIMKES